MRSAGLIGAILALGSAYVIYNAQIAGSDPAGAVSPKEQVDVMGIRASLLEIGQAERLYASAHGAYGTLEQLRADGAPELGAERRGYVFHVEPRGAEGFRATAAPADPARSEWPTLTIDETMEITSR